MAGRVLSFAVVALVCGMLTGAAVSVSSLESRVTCLPGRELGFSGPLATTQWLVVAPPGGSANYSEWSSRTFIANGSTFTSGSGYAGSANGSVAQITVVNWTLYAVASSQTSSFLRADRCPAYSLAVTYPSIGNSAGCVGCQVTLPVAASVGARVVLPSTIPFEGYPGSIFNGTYAPQPFGSFSWSLVNGSVDGGETSSLSSAGISFEIGDRANASQDFVALSESTLGSARSLGIPIQLLSAGSRVVSSPLSTMFPGWTTWYNVTYIFPVATDQGSWDVFEAAPGSPDSIGGLLFEEIAPPLSSSAD